MHSERYKLSLPILLQRFTIFVFISPHLDDAVLSCGQLLETVHKYKKESLIVSIFTQPTDPPYSLFATKFLLLSGYFNAKKLFDDRKEEDMKAAHILGAKCVHLGFVDAAWRKKVISHEFSYLRWFMKYFPTFTHVYDNSKKLFSGEPANEDNAVRLQITKKLNYFLTKNNKQRMLLFAPLGIGGHVDHIIVRNATKDLDVPVLYWEDFPYNTQNNSYKSFFSREKGYYELFEIKSNNKSIKYNAIHAYKSQLRVLFPNGHIPKRPEKYYIPTDSIKRRKSFADFSIG